ncbi:MAG: copper homeostasis protein CutC [Dysgonamonadaceae bacterium]|jgi:copper homeostasis protein|nr:copper homeostasis protein CutC [Dysgonamonadaceae bacterium]MDD3356478.1 copper homeostasis protein CutC [Dysgonamonadaceae bacterium]MDD3728277.1 copper homeostasis protein CutC [Dysgonamonadaceae bacterium]MDD4246864.1 copper homeostasis protein CutC [Dysgonamonadaceae bacterium]HUI33011.1 copper homeostasis protein CutC [Dysgonamonadaceae bacterium]
MNYKIEICTNSVTSSVEAEKGGAYRVELCAGIPEGGTTPSYGEIAVARELLNIKLNVIIRPRGGDFLYSDVEHQTMLRDIEIAKELGVDGVVIGCLTADGEIDMQRNKELIEAAKGMSVTFHRAFDMCKDPFKSLEEIISLGCERILTSGQQPTAIEGVLLLKQLVVKADNRIIIMPGSGVNEENIASLAKETGATEFHFSAREPVNSKMIYRNPNLKMGGTAVSIDEYIQNVTNADKVKRTIDKLKS